MIRPGQVAELYLPILLVCLTAAIALFGGPTLAAICVAALTIGIAGLVGIRYLHQLQDQPKTAVLPNSLSIEQWGKQKFPSLLPIAIFSLLIHWLAAFLMNLSSFADSLAPDHLLYRTWGKLLVEYHLNFHATISNLNGYNPNSMYYYLNAVVWYFAEDQTSLALSLINPIFHLLSAYLFSLMAYDIYNARAAKITFFLSAFFPSLLIYSSLNLRDALSWLFIAMTLFGAMRLRKKDHLLIAAIFLAAGLIGTSLIRTYILILLVTSLAAAQLFTYINKIHYAILSSILVVLCGSFVSANAGISFDVLSMDSLATMEQHRYNLKAGGSASGIDGNISSLTGMLFYMPKGVAFFMLSPFPWMIRNARQAMSLPELGVWYIIVPMATIQIIRESFKRIASIAPILIPFICISVAYGLVEGNAGTANRHRGQITPIVFIFFSGMFIRIREQKNPNFY